MWMIHSVKGSAPMMAAAIPRSRFLQPPRAILNEAAAALKGRRILGLGYWQNRLNDSPSPGSVVSVTVTSPPILGPSPSGLLDFGLFVSSGDLPPAAFPVRRPQLELLQLARRCADQSVPKFDRGGAFEMGQALPGEVDDFLRRCL